MELNDHSTPKADHEPDKISAGKVILVTLAVSVVLAVLLLGLKQFYNLSAEKQIYESVLKPESTRLQKLRAREDSLLNSYEFVDSVKGIYRIPIDSAMKIIVLEARLQSGQLPTKAPMGGTN